MYSYGIIVHGGAGTSDAFSDGCKKACEAGFELLRRGKRAIDAVVEAVRILEDDGRFNAGVGSALRLDGRTIEMDASVMDSNGNIGVVIAIRNVRNPVLVARAVTETPHVILAGEGATLFARRKGFEFFCRVSQKALDRHREILKMIKEKKLAEGIPFWKGYDISTLWNFDEVSYKELFCDTVGAVALDNEGVFASATSTGGFSPMMLGRVGDTPLIGCGFYAGLTCAVAVTGMGEEIIRKMVARQVYERVSKGEAIEKVCKKSVDTFHTNIKVGIIGISKEGYAIESNTEMAYHILFK